jgi:hypothetical protein
MGCPFAVLCYALCSYLRACTSIPLREDTSPTQGLEIGAQGPLIVIVIVIGGS